MSLGDMPCLPSKIVNFLRVRILSGAKIKHQTWKELQSPNIRDEKIEVKKVGSGEVRTHQRPPDSWPNGFLLYRSPKSAKYRLLNYCATKDSRLETSLIIPGHNP